MPRVVLEACGVGMTFGKGELAVRALHATDLRVARGEVLVIMGPSGSGKTTLLSILGFVLTPSEGHVLLDSRPVTRASADELAALRRDRIGFVFQQFNLLAGLTALENAALPLLLRGWSRERRTAPARAALGAVGLADKAASPARNLSGGQQQRVAIARALAGDAEVLLCDEPTASLDSRTGAGILDSLAHLARARDRAVVIVTHDERVLRVADRLVAVEDGRVRIENRAPLGEGRERDA